MYVSKQNQADTYIRDYAESRCMVRPKIPRCICDPFKKNRYSWQVNTRKHCQYVHAKQKQENNIERTRRNNEERQRIVNTCRNGRKRCNEQSNCKHGRSNLLLPRHGCRSISQRAGQLLLRAELVCSWVQQSYEPMQEGHAPRPPFIYIYIYIYPRVASLVRFPRPQVHSCMWCSQLCRTCTVVRLPAGVDSPQLAKAAVRT